VKIEGGGPTKPVCKTKPYFTFTFENKVAVVNAIRRPICPVAVECPASCYLIFKYKMAVYHMSLHQVKDWEPE
jgi:hypothetical protein